MGRFKSSRSSELTIITEVSLGSYSNASKDDILGVSQESRDLSQQPFILKFLCFEGKSSKNIASL
jgi:hypothetical protein